MPKIPTYTAQGAASTIRLPDVPRVPDIPVLRNAGAALLAQGLGTLSEGAQSLAHVGRIIEQQKDDLEALRIQYDYDPKLKTIADEVLADPTVDNPVLEFSQRAQELQASYAMKNPGVKESFQLHIDKTFPTMLRNVAVDALKQQTQQNVATLHELGDTLSTEAATASPELRDKAIVDYTNAVNTAQRSGTLGPVQAADAKIKFRSDVMTKNMAVMASTNPYTLFRLDQEGVYAGVDPLVRLQHLEAARTAIEQDDVRADARFKVAQDLNYKYYGTLANEGKIPDSELAMMASGQHPYVTDPEQVRTLARINANPILADSGPVEAILLNFRSMSMSSPEKVLDAAEKARTELDHYRRTVDKRDPALLKAYREVQEVELRMATAERSARAEVRAEDARAQSARREERIESRQETSHRDATLERDLKLGTAWYKANSPPRTAPQAEKRRKAQEVMDLSAMRLLLEQGIPWKEAAESLLNKQKTREFSRPESPRDLVRPR